MELITIEKWRDLEGNLWDTSTDCKRSDDTIEAYRKDRSVREAALVFKKRFAQERGLDEVAYAKSLAALQEFLRTPEGREAVRDLSRALW